LLEFKDIDGSFVFDLLKLKIEKIAMFYKSKHNSTVLFQIAGDMPKVCCVESWILVSTLTKNQMSLIFEGDKIDLFYEIEGQSFIGNTVAKFNESVIKFILSIHKYFEPLYLFKLDDKAITSMQISISEDRLWFEDLDIVPQTIREENKNLDKELLSYSGKFCLIEN
jgi:hypothetical protein